MNLPQAHKKNNQNTLFENMWKETEDIFCEPDPGAHSTFCEENLIVPLDPEYTQGEEITQGMKMR